MVAIDIRQLLCILVLVACHKTALASGWWMDEPYGNQEYNSRELYSDNVTLVCEDDIVTGSYQVEYWIRPDLTVMMKGDSESFWTLDGIAGWEVSVDGTEMRVNVLQESQFGFYHCVVYDTPNYYVIKKAINYKGPYFGDLWPKYRLNTIIGCSAAGGFLVISLVLMLIYHFRFQNDSDDVTSARTSRSSSTSSSSSSSFPSTSRDGSWSPEGANHARHRKAAQNGGSVEKKGQDNLGLTSEVMDEKPLSGPTYVNVGGSEEDKNTWF